MTSESDMTRDEEVDHTHEKSATPEKKIKIEDVTCTENESIDDEQVEKNEKEALTKNIKSVKINSENEHTDDEEEVNMKETKTTPSKKIKVKEEDSEKDDTDEVEKIVTKTTPSKKIKVKEEDSEKDDTDGVEKIVTKTTPKKKRKMKEENSEKENKEFEETQAVDTKTTLKKTKTTPKKKAKTTPKKQVKTTIKKKAKGKIEKNILENENEDDEKVEEMDTNNTEEAIKETISNDDKVENMDIETDSEDVDVIKKRKHLTAYFKKKDHSINQVYQSKIPQICKDEPCQLGVDEAGRGPVLGPMVYGIAYAPLSQKQILVDMGCADSKTLNEDKRDAILDKICDNEDKMGWAVDAISPNYIANCMYRRSKTSLNEVSMQSAIDLIKMTLEAGVFVTEIYVDTVGKPEKYQARLEGIFPGIKITVAKKADSTYPIVSAASICAKVSRDHALRAWQFREAENETNYGSGYPNDPATKTWLSDNVDPIFGFPQLVRFSWSTAEKILESKAVTVEWEEVEEEDSPPPTQKISKFFAPSPAKSEVTKKRHNFFTHRCLSSAVTL